MSYRQIFSVLVLCFAIFCSFVSAQTNPSADQAFITLKIQGIEITLRGNPEKVMELGQKLINISKLETKVIDQEKQIAELMARDAKNEMALADLKKKLRLASDALIDFNKAIVEGQSALAMTQKELITAQTNADQQQKNTYGLMNELNSAKTALSEAQKEISILKTTSAKTSADNVELTKKLKTALEVLDPTTVAKPDASSLEGKVATPPDTDLNLNNKTDLSRLPDDIKPLDPDAPKKTQAVIENFEEYVCNAGKFLIMKKGANVHCEMTPPQGYKWDYNENLKMWTIIPAEK